MTVQVTTTRMPPYVGNGVVQDFPFAFPILHESHVRVVKTAAGVDTVLVRGTDYSVTGVRAPAGNVHTLVPLPSGELLTISRSLPMLQNADLSDLRTVRGQNVEDMVDLVYYHLLNLDTILGSGDPDLARALLLGESDIDGAGSYRAKSNRIQDLANPIAGRDAVNRQTLEAWAQGGLGGPIEVPPIWEIVSDGTNQYGLPGATLSDKNTYTVSVDGVAQLRSSFLIDITPPLPHIMFDTDIPNTMVIEVQCIGYSRPIDPIPVYTAGARPVADLSILGMRIRWRPTDYGNPGDLSPTLQQICDLNSSGAAEWVTLGLTT